MDLWHSLNGLVELEIISADPAASLSRIYNLGIPLENVKFVDELTIRFRVRRQNLKRILVLTETRGEQWKILAYKGLYWRMMALLKRPVLLLGLAVLVFLTVFIPTRVLFFRIEGNVNVPDNRILELASQYGIQFGASRRDVRSEKVKNALLGAIPELEWVGINTAGCVATISVRERQVAENQTQTSGISSIVAARDGVIQEITVTGGSPSVKQGQAVKAGQVLISGYTDCGLSIRAQRAKGEIYATTSRKITFVMPENTASKGEEIFKFTKYSVIIGKKRINFYQGSGILDNSCVKMYEENYVMLPGGFYLPIAIVIETWIEYEQNTPTASTEEHESVLSHLAESYLRDQMIAGKILSKDEAFSQQDGCLLLEGEYGCLEMIGKERNEEIIAP